MPEADSQSPTDTAIAMVATSSARLPDLANMPDDVLERWFVLGKISATQTSSDSDDPV